jgi:DivIVA domain-containing protein
MPEVRRVSLDRQSIERKDFPVGRRGYDPEAVDAHLKGLADELDEFKRSARRKSETLASSASDQVRTIVEAAATSAADIQRQAEDEAREIRDEAAGEAQTIRGHATDQAREYVGKVSQSTSTMLERLDAMESELSALIESLRTGSNRLNADLQLLEGNITDVRTAAVSPRERFEPEPPEPAVPEYMPEPAVPEYMPEPAVPECMSEPAAGAGDVAAADQGNGVEQPEYASYQPDAANAGHDDNEGARLIALNMALSGTPRDETERYLAANFQLEDRQALLDEVYAAVEG